MATYTAEELKTYTGIPEVQNWEDSKILLYQSIAESMLTSMDLDTSGTGYSAAYNGAVVMIFDWLSANPGLLQSSSRGKVAKNFYDQLPVSIQLLLKPYIDGSNGALTGAKIVRKDIGLY